jgi:2-oxoglutarate dehydrogenase E1 component
VLLLPHGFEGQGPEHSSARLERFLMLSAEDNIQVVYASTPAQYFHVLRRQVLRRWRKPLILMTPKSLLRHPEAVSSLEQLASGAFRRVLPDDLPADRPVSRILICAGKIFYELQKFRRDTGRDDVALLRLEQLYPLALGPLESALKPYSDGTPVVWVQEEPENMGAWRFLRAALGHTLLGRFPFSALTRPASASPATGSFNAHKIEQERLMEAAFQRDEEPVPSSVREFQAAPR